MRITPIMKSGNLKSIVNAFGFSKRIRSIFKKFKEKTFEAVRGKSTIDPSIVSTNAFKIMHQHGKK